MPTYACGIQQMLGSNYRLTGNPAEFPP